MCVRNYPKMILLCVLVAQPGHCAMADSFLDALLRFTGISSTPSQVRGTFITGNLWLAEIDASGANQLKQITSDRTYHSPLWIPGCNKILAVNEKKLIQLNIEGNEEKILYNLSESEPTILIGFDKSDSNSVLIIQGGKPKVLSLNTGQVTYLPYDEKNSEDSKALDLLMSDFRNYGNTEVFIERLNKTGSSKPKNKIHIKEGNQDSVIFCPTYCAQPALMADRRRLVFVDEK